LGIVGAGVFTGQMPFLSLNQQYPSTEVTHCFDMVNAQNILGFIRDIGLYPLL